MIPEKLKQLIQLLTEKTLAKQANWNRGSGPNQFKLSLDNGVSVTVAVWEENWRDVHEVIVFNDAGEAILKYVEDSGTSVEDVNLLIKLHSAASAQFYKVDETMDALISAINGTSVIGNIEPPKKSSPSENDDDDLPF